MEFNKKKIIGGVTVALIVILLLLFWWLLGKESAAPVNTTNTPTDGPGGSLNIPKQTQTDVTQITEPVLTEEEEVAQDQSFNLKRLAAAFAERYGSFSNQSDYENLEELMSLMSFSLADQTAGYVRLARTQGTDTPEYVGVTTRALVVSVDLYDDVNGLAEVLVNTQREEITTSNVRVYYQKLLLGFVKEGEEWKVNSVSWLEEAPPGS